MIPILVLTPAWLVGIVLQNIFNLDSLWLWLLVGLGGGLALVLRLYRIEAGRWHLTPLMGLSLVAVGLGGLRLLLAQPSTGPDNLTYYLDQPEVKIVGQVSAEPTYSERTDRFRLDAEEVWTAGATEPRPVHGQIYVFVTAGLRVEWDERVELTGKLVAPKEFLGSPDNPFPYRDWLARQGIYATLSYPHLRRVAASPGFDPLRWFHDLNTATRDTLQRFVPDEEGQVLSSVLLGDTQNLDPTIHDQFSLAGVTHILVVSGSNLSILIWLVGLVLLPYLSRRKVILITLVVVLFYVLLVGVSPSVARAALMTYLALFGWLAGREYNGGLGLAGSALLMTLWQPQVLFDIGFQLSFLATLGILLLARRRLPKNLLGLLAESLLISIAAELLTLPLIAYYFHQLSLVSLAANVMAVPVIPLITLLALALLTLSWLPFVGPLWGGLVGGLAWLGTAYLLAIVKFWATIEDQFFGDWTLQPGLGWLVLYYIGLGFVLWWRQVGRKSQAVREWLSFQGLRLALIAGLSLTGLVWLAVWLV